MSDSPFVIAQLVVLASFLAIGFAGVIRFGTPPVLADASIAG